MICSDSKILTPQYLNNLQGFFAKYKARIKKWQLLYRGSDHGFTPSDFHAKCDNKGPTVTLVLNDIDRCFGGFTMLDWD